MRITKLPNLKLYICLRNLKSVLNLHRKMESKACETDKLTVQTITEGSACIKTTGKVFYNPVQEFNRDLRLESDQHTSEKNKFSSVFQYLQHLQGITDMRKINQKMM